MPATIQDKFFEGVAPVILLIGLMMNPDDPVCLCFHVSRRKVVNFIRIEKPRRPSQLSECYGAGTGCGWCRPMLERLLNDAQNSTSSDSDRVAVEKGSQETPQSDSAANVSATGAAEVSAAQYAQSRAEYVRRTGAKLPTGATPVDDKSVSPNEEIEE